MAIKGIEERSFARLPMLGKLRKGAPRQDGVKAPPKDLDTFRFAASAEGVADAFAAAYGSVLPREVEVYLPYATKAKNWDYFYETWGAGARLKYRCDGENWIKWWDAEANVHRLDPKPCPICAGTEAPDRGEHQPTGRLVVILPGLLKAGYAGVVMLETHSITDIYAINAGLMVVDELRADSTQAGDLRGIAFTLRREFRAIPTRAHGVQKRWFVALEPDAAWLAQQGELLAALTGGVGLREYQAQQAMAPVIDGRDGHGDYWGGDEGGDGDPEAPQARWQDTEEAVDRFRAEAKRLKVAPTEVLVALGDVKRAGDFKGSLEDACGRLERYDALRGHSRTLKLTPEQVAEHIPGGFAGLVDAGPAGHGCLLLDELAAYLAEPATATA